MSISNRCVCGRGIDTVNAMSTLPFCPETGTPKRNRIANSTGAVTTRVFRIGMQANVTILRVCKQNNRESYMLSRLIATSSAWFTLPIRAGLAAVMIAHGAQKVLGSFGGPGFNEFISGTTPFGFMRPAWAWLAAAALSELIGGILIALGFLTRVG